MILRKANSSDVATAANLMRAAYVMWEPIGFSVSSLTEIVVGSFFAQDGYVATDSQGKAIGVFSINFKQPRINGQEMHVARAHREDKTILLNPSITESLSGKRCAYLYSLAVEPAFSRVGIGRKCLEFAQDEALRHQCDGLLLETGERGAWLVDWYRRSGFQLIGNFTRNSQPLVFMLKDLTKRRASA